MDFIVMIIIGVLGLFVIGKLSILLIKLINALFNKLGDLIETRVLKS